VANHKLSSSVYIERIRLVFLQVMMSQQNLVQYFQLMFTLLFVCLFVCVSLL